MTMRRHAEEKVEYHAALTVNGVGDLKEQMSKLVKVVSDLTLKLS